MAGDRARGHEIRAKCVARFVRATREEEGDTGGNQCSGAEFTLRKSRADAGVRACKMGTPAKGPYSRVVRRKLRPLTRIQTAPRDAFPTGNRFGLKA